MSFLKGPVVQIQAACSFQHFISTKCNITDLSHLFLFLVSITVAATNTCPQPLVNNNNDLATQDHQATNLSNQPPLLFVGTYLTLWMSLLSSHFCHLQLYVDPKPYFSAIQLETNLFCKFCVTAIVAPSTQPL